MYSLKVVDTEETEMAAQVEVQVYVCIVVGLRQLPIVGSKSEMAAQVGVQVHVWV